MVVGLLVGVVAGSPVVASVPPTSPPGDSTAPVVAGPVGEASAIAAAVELQPVNAEFAALAAPSAVSVGDVLRTDATGYAQVAYGDGSFTRLDVSTEFTVVSLVDAAGAAATRTEMGLGRTWNRVESAGQEFTVETSAATATVTGTAFAISCVAVGSCRFLVVEGSIQLTLPDGTTVDVVAPASVDVTNGVVTGPIPVPYGAVFSEDTWLLDNTQRDAAAGFPERVTIYQAHGPAYAAFAGHYVGTTSLTDVVCVPECIAGEGPENVGVEVPFDGNLSFSCTDDGACSLVGASGVPYTFDGTSYTATIPDPEQRPCSYDQGSDGVDMEQTGTGTFQNTYTITPVSASVIGGIYVVDAVEIRRVAVETVEGFCPVGDALTVEVGSREDYFALPAYLGTTRTFVGTATRQ
jgi:hypothetical protein